MTMTDSDEVREIKSPPDEALLKELYKVADIDKSFIKNGTLCDSESRVVSEMKDVIKSEEQTRLAIFRVTYKNYSIVAF